MSAPARPFAALSTVRRSLAVVTLATLAGLAGAYAVTSQLSATYQARSSVVVTYAGDARAVGSTGLRAGDGEGHESPAFDLSMLQATVPTIAHLAESRNVVQAAARSAGVPSGQVLGRADADYEPGDTIITLTASATTAAGASAMANAVADVVHRQVSDGRTVLGRRGVLAAQPLDRASPPAAPAMPKAALNLALGATLGLLAGIAVVALGARPGIRLRTSNEVEAELGLPVLGTIPRVRRSGGNVRKALRRRRVAASVRATVAALSPCTGPPGRRLLVTSPAESDAKTFVAALLGAGFAEQEFQVTLMDLDFGRPRLPRHFPERATEDLRRMLATDGQPPPGHREPLWVVSTEAISPLVGRRLLGSAPFRTLAGRAASRADVVVLNGPPVLLGSGLSALAESVDAAVLVVTSETTRTSDARLAARTLGRLGIPVAGVVIANACDTGGSGTPAAVTGFRDDATSAMAGPDARPEPLPELEGAGAARQREGTPTRW